MRLARRVQRVSRLIEVEPPKDLGFLPTCLAEDVAGYEIGTMSLRARLKSHTRYCEAAAPVIAGIEAAMAQEATP